MSDEPSSRPHPASGTAHARVPPSSVAENAPVGLLAAVTRAANEAASVDDAFARTLAHLRDYTGWPVGHAYLADPRTGELASTGVWHLPEPGTLAEFRHVADAMRFAPGVGVLGRVVATKEPVWLEDAARDPAFLRASAAAGLHAGFMVPVLVGDDVAGVLECFADRPVPRDEALLAILPHIGIQLGRAVERARAHTALSESETRFRLLVQNVAEYGIYMLDPEGRVASWNEGAQRMTGYAAPEIIGRPFAVFYPADDVARDKPAWELDVAARDGRFEEDGWRVRKDGSRFWANVLITALRDPGGALVGFAKIVRDLTERHAAESALRARTEELARSNAELEQFAYVASHDLQEPLRMVATYTQLLQRRYQGKLDAQADKYIAFAVEGAQRMHALIVDLLTLSRVGTQGRPLVPTDTNAVLARALRTLEAPIAESGAEVTVDPLPDVLGDARQLEQLFQNLLGNAVKFRRAGTSPRVHVSHVSAHPEEGMAHVAVRDDGIGIDPQFAEQIFVLFQRLHARAEYPGTGIGLAICKKIVERHGGRIWVESAPDEGAAFHFTLPLAPAGG